MIQRARLTLILLAGLALASPAMALQQAVSGQVRQFGTHKNFEDRPFANGDFGYGAAYEIRDTMGYWQIGALYTPDAGSDSDIDYAVTPFLNLMIKDKIFLAGLGIDKTYMSRSSGDDDWTDVYWTILTGLEFPISQHLSLTGLAVYDLNRLGKLGDFRFDDVEFAAALNLLF